MCLSFSSKAFADQKKGRRVCACGRLNLLSSVNYKASAQAGAATCQRQAQAFWFVQYFMGPPMIYAPSADVNCQGCSLVDRYGGHRAFRADSRVCNPSPKRASLGGGTKTSSHYLGLFSEKLNDSFCR